MNFALSQTLFWIPTIILSLVGIAVAAVQFSRHPSASVLVLLACVLSLIRAIALPLLQGLGAGSNLDERMQWQMVISMIGTVSSAVVFILFLFAVYSGRQSAKGPFANQNPYDNANPIVMAEIAHRDSSGRM